MTIARLIATSLTCTLLWATAVHAQQEVRVRGTIAAFDGKLLTVTARNGNEVRAELPENVAVSTTRPFSLADIKPGMVMGVTTVKRTDGTLVAIDVRPIPPTARQGLSPYDLAPDSVMTNAAVEGLVESAAGQTLTLNYQTGKVTVLVPPGTPMSQSAPGTRADLKIGEAAVLTARQSEGGLSIVRIQVAKDGVRPTQ